MLLSPIITSLLDNDLYKYSMGQCIFHQHNKKICHWTFKDRNENLWNSFSNEMKEKVLNEIKEQVKHYCTLRYTEEELTYLLEHILWLHRDYIDFLRFWHPRMEEIDIQIIDGHLSIEIEGSATNVSPYETPIMSIITETMYRLSGKYDEMLDAFKKNLEDKIVKLKDGTYDMGTYSEFGMRRRLSFEAQDYLIGKLVGLPGFIGTSDVLLAKKHGVRACGTMAHEFIMLVGQGYPERNPAYSTKFALDSWVKEYGILNGIALTDTITTDCFLKDFQLTFATLFSGVRHDSGDPYEWGDKMIAHFKSLGIDPMTKTLLFSDSLNGEKATAINKYFKGKAKVAFGIGTWFSGPVKDALNIVIKTTAVDGRPVAKLSDAPGKNMCKDPNYIEYLRKTIEWRMNH